MSRWAKIGALLAGLAAVAGGAYYWLTQREIAVRTASVERDVKVSVFGIGTVEAQVLSKVGFQIAGRIVALEADQGDLIKAGALLARLDDAAQQAKLRKSEAALRQAAANMVRAEAQRERANTTFQQKQTVNLRRQSLVARGTISQESADDAQAAADIARSDLRVVEADAQIAAVLKDDAAAQRQIDAVLLEQHALRAPFDARVIARHKELGSIANAGEPVFTLIAPGSIWVRAHVDEALAGGLAVGQTAWVRLRSEAATAVEAVVVRIDQENDRVTEERRVYVRCKACPPEHQIRYLGEQAEVEIVKGVIPSGLFVPLNLVEAYDGRAGTVWVLENGRLAKRRVEFGERLLDGRLQIVSELTPNTLVVVEARPDLRVGRPARPASDKAP